MRVLVCGSRHFKDYFLLKDTLDKVHDGKGHPYEDEITELIHGAAKGADTLAALWASHTWKHNGESIEVKAYPADWKGLGKAAGPIRNKQMLKEGKPDKVIAFLAKDSRGTKNMIEQATKANIPVEIINI